MQLPELGSVNFKICTKITGNSFPQRKILSTLSQKELFPCRFSAPPPPRLLVPSSLCSAFSHVCVNILHPQLLFFWQREDSSELSVHLAFQRHYITCCWAELIPCGFPSSSQGLSWIRPVVWPDSKGWWFPRSQVSKTAGNSSDLEQCGKVWLKPCFSLSWGNRGLCGGADWLWAVWDRRSETLPITDLPSWGSAAITCGLHVANFFSHAPSSAVLLPPAHWKSQVMLVHDNLSPQGCGSLRMGDALDLFFRSPRFYWIFIYFF